MRYSLSKEKMVLLGGEVALEPVSLEENPVGFCVGCGGDLQSLAYYRSGGGWLVAALCQSCEVPVLMSYDQEWGWLGDHELQEEVGQEVVVSSLPGEKLKAVFTKAEIRDMIACEEGRPYVRQNLYRARVKYEKFYELFGIRIDI